MLPIEPTLPMDPNEPAEPMENADNAEPRECVDPIDPALVGSPLRALSLRRGPVWAGVRVRDSAMA
jgi:hypothetical protein